MSSLGYYKTKLCNHEFSFLNLFPYCSSHSGEDLTSKADFTAALQFAGFNPSCRLTSSHWGSTTRQMTYSQFSNITEIQPLPTEDSLLAAFQKLDDKRSTS